MVDTNPPACDCDPTRGETQWVVVSNYRACSNDPGRAYGLDLDGMGGGTAASCSQPDFAPSGTTGDLGPSARTIDNSYATSLATCDRTSLGTSFGESLQDAKRSGDLLWLFRVDGIDDFEEDCCVRVTWYAGVMADDGDPVLDDSDSLTPGQRFEITTGDAAASSSDSAAAIVGGMLTAHGLELELRFLAAMAVEPVRYPMNQGVLQVAIGPEAWRSGQVGAAFDIEELVASVEAVGGDALPIDLVRSTLLSIADLDPDAEGVCQSVSIGLGIEAVSAVVTP